MRLIGIHKGFAIWAQLLEHVAHAPCHKTLVSLSLLFRQQRFRGNKLSKRAEQKRALLLGLCHVLVQESLALLVELLGHSLRLGHLFLHCAVKFVDSLGV